MTFDSGFYATIAQIIPVFWLALIIESRITQSSRVGHFESIAYGAVSSIAALAEICAIWLTGAQSPPYAAGVAMFVVICALIYVMLMLSLGRSTRREAKWAGVAGVAVLAAFVGFLLLLAS